MKLQLKEFDMVKIAPDSVVVMIGKRNTGKSFLTSKILFQAKKEKTFDRIYIITPSFNSNVAYFGKFIKREDVFDPKIHLLACIVYGYEAGA